MQQDYEAEQERLKLEQNVLSESIKQQKERADGCDQFHALVEKYVDVPELTPTIVNEYIKRIIVHAPDKSSGHRVQRIQSFFNFLEDTNLPLLSEPVACQAKHSKEKTA